MVLLQRNFFFQGSSGVTHFPGGGGIQLFQGGGVKMLIFIETHITCDFPGGSEAPPLPPLDPHMNLINK